MSGSQPASVAFAAPTCTIEVYPFEGGNYTIQGGQIAALNTSHSVRGDVGGKFTIRLAPGGPRGVDDPVPWTEIITPMSFVLIGMQRGPHATVVMAGVVTSTAEAQAWSNNPPNAARQIIVTGMDFSYFFFAFSYFAMTAFGVGEGNAFGESLNIGSAGIPASISQGLFTGANSSTNSPVALGQFWYEKIMAQPDYGIMGTTVIPYKNNSRLLFYDVMSTVWEDYPNVFIPMGVYGTAGEGPWISKFKLIFPEPWYEFFITTAEAGDYGTASGQQSSVQLESLELTSGPSNPSGGASSTTSGGPPLVQNASPGANATTGKLFTMASLPAAAAAGPKLVARINPVPAIKATASAPMQPITFEGLDMERWNGLRVYDETVLNFITNGLTFSVDDARNFYYLNPTWARNEFGNSNTNIMPFTYLFAGAGDPASIHRYGYKPEFPSFIWMSDMQGTAAQNDGASVTAMSVANLMGRLIGWYHPTPLMARTSVTIPLRPDIRVGNRFRFNPFKGPAFATWDFYIESVSHNWSFGATPTTTLELSRGLPTSVYSGSENGGILEAIHMGNAQRLNGAYAAGLPPGLGPPLMSFSPSSNMNAFAGNIAKIFVTPQASGGGASP